jgi:hypothetical protein
VGPKNEQIVAVGTIRGGSVAGVPDGFLWSERIQWDSLHQERQILVSRDPHSSQTVISIGRIASTLPPIELSFRLADGILTVSYNDQGESPVQQGRRLVLHTPNNNENRGDCPNEVRHQDGKYCTSRTKLTLSTSAPHFFKNARLDCEGEGCPWTSHGPVTISDDGLTASAFLDNWGHDVDAILVADEYEHLSANQCGTDSSVAIVRDKPVLLAVRKKCLTSAIIKWTSLPDFSQGIFHFGEKSADGAILVSGSLINGDEAAFVSYVLKK